MPESLSAFCKMVSLTAAKTNRMFDVSVACVRLGYVSQCESPRRGLCLLGVQIQVCTIDLVESPQEILRCSIDIVATGVVRKVIP